MGPKKLPYLLFKLSNAHQKGWSSDRELKLKHNEQPSIIRQHIPVPLCKLLILSSTVTGEMGDQAQGEFASRYSILEHGFKTTRYTKTNCSNKQLTKGRATARRPRAWVLPNIANNVS